MNLSDLLAEVRRLGGCLAVEAGKLHYRGPSNAKRRSPNQVLLSL